MREKLIKLTWALLVLAGGLTATLTPKNADAQTCRQMYNECTASCAPGDSLCSQECQCVLITCHGYQCN